MFCLPYCLLESNNLVLSFSVTLNRRRSIQITFYPIYHSRKFGKMKYLKLHSYLFVIFLIVLSVQKYHHVKAAGCVDNQSCTDLCGFAGAGECIDGKYCKCANCPGRSIYELASLPKICTLDPTCICPAPTLSLTNGRIYSGHRCLHGTSLVCICFCLPTTPGALLDVIKCPFPKNSTSTITTPVNSNA